MDWSSDVCSADLAPSHQPDRSHAGDPAGGGARHRDAPRPRLRPPPHPGPLPHRRDLPPLSHILFICTGNAARSVMAGAALAAHLPDRSEEHTSELQSLMRISYDVFCLTKHKLLLPVLINTNTST